MTGSSKTVAARPLLIRCPRTNRLIETGVAIDPMTYESGTFLNNSSGCPYCGEAHTWSKENTLLGGDPARIDNN